MQLAWRICKSSKAPLIFLTFVSAGLSFWCSQLLDDNVLSTETFGASRLFGSHKLVDWRWVQQTQSRMRTAFVLSRHTWPFPVNWKPQVDFNSMLLPLNASGEPSNSTLPQDSYNLWLFCAGQYEDCACYGSIRWGIEGRWVYVPPPNPLVANHLKCQVGKLAGAPDLIDVSPGDDSKHCECQVNTASHFFKCMNVLALPRSERKKIQPEEGANCNKFAEDASAAGRFAWTGLMGICTPGWIDVPLGPKQIPYKKVTAFLKTYVAATFTTNYKRLYKDGWLRRAFVSYLSGPLEGIESQTMELLVESVHRFSVYPIVVLHAGMATPLHWSPRIFPRLVLLSINDLPIALGHDYTLLLAAVICRVQTGILLNHNSLVFPGIDRLFIAAEHEINAQYPYPIMPAHFINKKPEDGGTYWPHVCAQGSCSKQSMRWSQFGLFWSQHALPFLSTTLRAILRDEMWETEPPFEPIRVRRARDIESLVNVALWRVGATKQCLGWGTL